MQRVCKIHTMESVALSTKERVPYIVCIEVIDSKQSVVSKASRKTRAASLQVCTVYHTHHTLQYNI
jgi:hypothetical protein